MKIICKIENGSFQMNNGNTLQSYFTDFPKPFQELNSELLHKRLFEFLS
jgi:hypothetical protein